MRILIRISFLLLFLSTAAQAQYFSSFSNLQIFTNIDGKIGFKDSLGNVIVEPKYQHIGWPFGGLQLVSCNGKYGYIDSLGVEVVETIYDYFSERELYGKPSPYLIAEINGKCGVVNIYNGNVLIPLKYKNIKSIGSNFYTAQKDGLYGVVSLSGAVRIPFKYARIESIGSNFYAAQKDGLYGIVSLSGAELTPFIYSYISYFGDNIIPVEIDNKKWGAIDTMNRTIIESSKKFKYIYAFRNGLSVFKSDKGKKGVINTKGESIIPAIYDEVDIKTRIPRIIVTQGDKKGVISYENRIIIPIEYEYINMLQDYHPWAGEREICYRDGEIGILYGEGYYVVPSNFFLAGKDNKQTMFNSNGKKIIDSMDEIRSLCNFKFIKVVNNGHLGLCDSLGNKIIPIKYKNEYIRIGDYGDSQLDRNTQINEFGLIISNKDKQFIIFADKAYSRTKEYDKIEIIAQRIISKSKHGDGGKYVLGFIVENNDKKGVMDRDGKIIIPIKYDEIKTERDKEWKIIGYTLYLNDKETFYKLP